MVPDIVRSPWITILLLKVLAPPIVWVPEVLTTVESTVILSAFAVIPSPPITLSVGVPEVPPPVKPVPAVTPSMSPVAPVATAVTLP